MTYNIINSTIMVEKYCNVNLYTPYSEEYAVTSGLVFKYPSQCWTLCNADMMMDRSISPIQ